MLKDNILSKQKTFLLSLIVGMALLIHSPDNLSSSSFKAYAQISSFEEPSLMPQTEAVTSYYDALLKAPLIVSQTTIVGLVFSHIFFQRVIRNRIQPHRNRNNSNMMEIIDDVNSYLRPLKR